MRNKSFEIALSAISAALATIFLVMGAYIPVLDLTAYMLSSIFLMLPIAKQFYMGGFLAYAVALILSLMISGGNFIFVLPFAIFFGLHPLVNALIVKKNINKWAALIAKIIWFDIVLLVLFKFTQLFVTDSQFVKDYIIKYIYIMIPVLGSLFFIVYDYAIKRAQNSINYFVYRLGK